MGYSFRMPIIYTQLYLVTISFFILRIITNPEFLSVTDGHRPAFPDYIKTKLSIVFSRSNVRLRKVIVIFVRTKSGNFVAHAGVSFESSGLFSLCVHLLSKHK